MRILTSFLAVIVMAGAALAVATSLARPVSAQDDPEAVVRAFVDALNAADLDGAIALTAADVQFTLTDSTQSQAGFGQPAFRAALEGTVDVHQHVEIIELTSEGNVVTAVAEVTDDEAEAAGVDRVIQPFTMTLDDAGLITQAAFTHDETDEQTVTYLEFYANPDATKPPPGVPTIAMAEQSGSGQTGVAAVVEDPDVGLTFVAIDIAGGEVGVLQPAHIHTGTCAEPGPIVQPLASVIDGGSLTFLSIAPEATDAGLIINVHRSAEEPGVYVSCGVVSAAAGPVPTATTAAAATPSPAPGVTAPNTGAGHAADDDSSRATYALAVAALLSGIGLVAWRIRSLTA